jgi:hypothetical protein
MLKLINKYEALKICDKCGTEETIIKSCYNNLLKQKDKEHHCRSCASSGHWQQKGKREIKSMFVPIGKKYKHKGHRPQAKWKVL